MTRLNLPMELQHFKVKEVCILLSVHPNTVHRYLQEGRLDGLKLSEGEIRVTGASLIKLIDEGRTRYSRKRENGEKEKVGYGKTGPVTAVKNRASQVLERLGMKS